jgi:hypothetical protein
MKIIWLILGSITRLIKINVYTGEIDDSCAREALAGRASPEEVEAILSEARRQARALARATARAGKTSRWN